MRLYKYFQVATTRGAAQRSKRVRSLFWIASTKIGLWVIPVLVFAFIPNLIHWGIKAASSSPSLWDVADMFLYVFVLWATLLAEVITDSNSKQTPPNGLMIGSSFVVGIFAALGFAGAQVKTTPTASLGSGLSFLLIVLIALTVLVCALYNIPDLIGAARAEFDSQMDEAAS
jgi:hypothetical protein